MKETLISVTVAARRFSDCISRVRYQGMSFLLEKNGVPVARIVPVQQNFGSEFERLATTLRQTRSSATELKEAEQPAAPDQRLKADERIEPQTASDLKRPRLNW